MTTIALVTLAAGNIGGAVIVLIIVGFNVVRWIKKQMDEAKVAQERRRQQIEQESRGGLSGTQSGTTSGGMSTEDIQEAAARRRAELERRAAVQRPAPAARPAAGTEPGNMTLAERLERARARQKYEQRAQELRKTQQAAQPQQAPRGAPVNRQESDRLAAATSKRRRVEAAQRAVAENQRQKQAQQAAVRKHDDDRRVAMDKPMGTADAPAAAQAATAAQPVSGKVVAVPGTRSRTGMVMGRSLREAMILKEILDPPLALRENNL
ncbi:MAG: hypothetical protein K8S99_12930 [Planctomycetes bacterium]|nr:hypothetical protein [Planctomycetota bacterium]